MINKNNIFCNKNNIIYKFIEQSTENVPPYWAKVFETNKILNENNDIDYVIWVDSDAFFIDSNSNKLNNLLNKYSNYSMIISSDMPPWEYNDFNAGVYIIKNDENGKNILNKWLSYYNKDKWNFNNLNNKWICNGPWAGIDYEQGSFVEYILKDNEYNKYIIKLPYYILNNNNCTDYNDISLTTHLAGDYKNDLSIYNDCNKFLENIIENFNNKNNNNNNNKLLYLFIIILLLIFISNNI